MCMQHITNHEKEFLVGSYIEIKSFSINIEVKYVFLCREMVENMLVVMDKLLRPKIDKMPPYMQIHF